MIPDEAYVEHPGSDMRSPTFFTDLVCRRIRKMTGDPNAICYEVPNRLAYHARRMERMAYEYHGRTLAVGLVIGALLGALTRHFFR